MGPMLTARHRGEWHINGTMILRAGIGNWPHMVVVLGQVKIIPCIFLIMPAHRYVRHRVAQGDGRATDAPGRIQGRARR